MEQQVAASDMTEIHEIEESEEEEMISQLDKNRIQAAENRKL